MPPVQLNVLSNSPPSTANPWYADGLAFTCTQCGNCCTGGPGYVWINNVELGRLAEFLNMSKKQVISHYCRRVGSRISLREHRNLRGQYDCTFLKEVESTREVEGQTVRYTKRICEIYPVRPLQCRTWPFWDGLLQSQRAWKAAKRTCPGMDVGRKWSRSEIESLRDAKDWPEIAPGSSAGSAKS